MSVVKRQHYVWRHYLRSWANNKDVIWTYLKQQDTIIKSNLMGVAQERYFYELIDFTNEEEDFLLKRIDGISDPLVKNLNLDFFYLFTSTSKLKKQLENTTTLINKDKRAEEIRNLEINLMEKVHGRFEDLGQKLVLCHNLDELKTINEERQMIKSPLDKQGKKYPK